MNAFKTVFLAVIAMVVFAGCATNNTESYNTTPKKAIPIDAVGPQSDKFARAAERFHQNMTGLNLCANTNKKGDAKVAAGLRDNNGTVSYDIDTSSKTSMECDFGTASASKPVAAQAPKVYLAPPTGLTATQPGVDEKAAPAEKPAAKK